ncbi:hypothetical protein INR49_015202 [Caranx melampygus]|nr:hypothetical protein INR49_015202 [Caranx melampygus]
MVSPQRARPLPTLPAMGSTLLLSVHLLSPFPTLTDNYGYCSCESLLADNEALDLRGLQLVAGTKGCNFGKERHWEEVLRAYRRENGCLNDKPKTLSQEFIDRLQNRNNIQKG